MRDKKEPHLNLLNLMTRNKIAQELEALAHLLDAHQDILAPVKSRWVYQKLRNFRAGMEGNISRLKRAFGLDRCNWQGWPGCRHYAWSASCLTIYWFWGWCSEGNKADLLQLTQQVRDSPGKGVNSVKMPG